MQLNGLDWVLLGIGLFCVGRGILRGAISQVFGIAGVLAGFVLASHYYESLSVQLSEAFPRLIGPQAVSFVLLFFLAWFCLGIVGFGISKLLQKSGLGFFDRFWGAAVGLAKALALAVILISALTFFLSPQNRMLHNSGLTPYVQEAAHVVIQATPDKVQMLFEKKQKELKRYWLDRDRGRDRVKEKTKLPFEKEARVLR
ncbi:CvpA family protein [Desulforhabdus amnigena]|uniref:CvpA family protein n=1 Tax=Desulforhabdus amnigena TaxID=40218 RepID=A0A9W6L7X9_9BACT|nr:CvpA family protein [Desulforhabdus amnigena]NLJ27588.1 CvpA family protein [Deltaproteobacteria bacterium]GLI35113.1 hypothetical protein DAMNIGENAA_25460 [Desulforhabdus amnigena]